MCATQPTTACRSLALSLSRSLSLSLARAHAHKRGGTGKGGRHEERKIQTGAHGDVIARVRLPCPSVRDLPLPCIVTFPVVCV